MPSLEQAGYRNDQTLAGLLKQRSRPHILIFDEEANISFAEPHALAWFEDHIGLLQDGFTEVIRQFSKSKATSEQFFGPVAGLVLRIVPLRGNEVAQFYAVFLESEARREDLREAVSRFSLTPREVEVLNRILDGMSAAEIAEELCIAQVTVFDHFKHITHKTKARNRADMLAKVFNWQPAIRHSNLDTDTFAAEKRYESRIH